MPFEIYGTLQITNIDQFATREYLNTEKGILAVGLWSTRFSFFSNGVFQSASGLFLNVDRDGKLVLGKMPHYGFKLHHKKGFYEKLLTYQKYPDFQLCKDGSVGYESYCVGAQLATLVFRPSWGGRTLHRTVYKNISNAY